MTRVLLVEDEFELANIVCRELKAAGYEVDLVSDGASALAAYSRLQPDLIILPAIKPHGKIHGASIDTLEILYKYLSKPILITH